MGEVQVVSVAGFPVMEMTQAELAEHLLSVLQFNGKTALLFANSNFIVRCRPLLGRMLKENVTLVNDGVGMDIAALLLRGRRFKANLNGTDFTPSLFRQAGRPLRVFLLGGRPGVARRAAGFVAAQLGQQVVGYCDGFAGMRDHDALIERINRAQTEVLLVALGNPLQEAWILQHRHAIDAGVVAGVGALFDFWSGDTPRAPQLLQRLRLEWLHRLCLEPRRLLRRYTLDILLFLAYCARDRRCRAEIL